MSKISGVLKYASDKIVPEAVESLVMKMNETEYFDHFDTTNTGLFILFKPNVFKNIFNKWQPLRRAYYFMVSVQTFTPLLRLYLIVVRLVF